MLISGESFYPLNSQSESQRYSHGVDRDSMSTQGQLMCANVRIKAIFQPPDVPVTHYAKMCYINRREYFRSVRMLTVV